MSDKPLHLDHNPLLIGLAGYAGAGKDTAARVLRRNHGFRRFAFADALKDTVYRTNGDVRKVVFEFGWEKAKRDYPFVREELVRVGVSKRETEGPYCWVNRVAGAMNDIKFDAVCITDVRFPNEAAWIRENGGIVVRVERLNVGPANEHEEPLLSERPVWNHNVKDSSDPDQLHELAAQLEDAVKMAERARNLLPIFDAGPLERWEAR